MPSTLPPEVSLANTRGAIVHLLVTCHDWAAMVCDSSVLSVYYRSEHVDSIRPSPRSSRFSAIAMTAASETDDEGDDGDGGGSRCDMLLTAATTDSALHFWKLVVSGGADGHDTRSEDDDDDGNGGGGCSGGDYGDVPRVIHLPRVELQRRSDRSVEATVSHVCFDKSGLLMALCRGKEIEVVASMSGLLFDRLCGVHRLSVTCAAFGTIKEQLLFSCSEDGTFAVWDLPTRQVVYHSSVICSTSALVKLCVSPVPSPSSSSSSSSSSSADSLTLDTLAVAAADGRMWIYDVMEGAGGQVRELHHMNLTGEMYRLRQRQQATGAAGGRGGVGSSYASVDDNDGYTRDIYDYDCEGNWGEVEVSTEPLAIALISKSFNDNRHHHYDGHHHGQPQSQAVNNAVEIDGKIVRRTRPYDNSGIGGDVSSTASGTGYQRHVSRGSLLVVTPSALLRISCHSFNIEVLLPLGGQWAAMAAAPTVTQPSPLLPSSSSNAVPMFGVGRCAAVVAAPADLSADCRKSSNSSRSGGGGGDDGGDDGGGTASTGHFTAVIATAFDSEVLFYDSHRCDGAAKADYERQHARQEEGTTTSPYPLSLFPSLPQGDASTTQPAVALPNNSPLRKDAAVLPVEDMYRGFVGLSKKKSSSSSSSSDLGRRKGSEGAGGAARRGKTKIAGGVRDQPVTFHSKIKSSGYSAAPTMVMFKGSGSKKTGAREKGVGDGSGSGGGSTAVPFRGRDYPLDSALPTAYQPQHDVVHAQQLDGSLPLTAKEARAKGLLPPIVSIRLSSDSKLVGVAFGDSSVSVYRLPISAHHGKARYYLGHNASVSSICFTHSTASDAKLVSASADGSSRLWLLNKPEAPLIINMAAPSGGAGAGGGHSSYSTTRKLSSAPTLHPATSGGVGVPPSQRQRRSSLPDVGSRGAIGAQRGLGGTAAAGMASRGLVLPCVASAYPRAGAIRRFSDGCSVRRGIITFTSPRLSASAGTIGGGGSGSGGGGSAGGVTGAVTGARFFYLDRFVVVACNGWVRMLTFRMDGHAANDLTRLKGGGQAKLAHSWMSGATTVTSLDCANSFLSPMVIAATSNRSVLLLDAATGEIARQINDAHTRPPHSVALPGSTAMDCMSHDVIDVFVTSAADSAVKMWDVRASSCVARFSSHVNNREQVGVAFSPCMRYLASGSEDKNAYIWDMRTGSLLAKLPGHTDVVSDVAFNGHRPQLLTASFDGTLRFHAEP